MRIENQDDGRLLYLGPSRRATLLEVVKVARDDGSDRMTWMGSARGG